MIRGTNRMAGASREENPMNFDPTRPWLRALALVTCVVFLATSAPAFADARDQLAAAEDAFLVADFDGALAQVNALIESGDLEGGALRDAWVLKARCEAGQGRRTAAVDAYCEVIRADASWAPDPDLYTKDEITLFEQARDTCNVESTKAPSPLPQRASSSGDKAWYQKSTTWYVIGGIVVVGVLAAALAGGGDDEGDGGDLPLPPPPPTN